MKRKAEKRKDKRKIRERVQVEREKIRESFVKGRWTGE